jgi:long-chain acyl-CoA synthetase
MLSSRNIMTSIGQGLARFRWLVEGERIFGPLPLFHSFAQNTCVWSGLYAGCTVILIPKIERKYILEGLAQRPTIFLGVPALYGLLCLLKTAPLESVRAFVCGGDALPDKIRSAFALVYQRKLFNGYGLTETSPTIAIDLDDTTEPTNNVGQPVVGLECAVRDDHGTDLPHGAIGQLWVRGDNVMLGYYNAPEMTQSVIKDGWFATGDLVYLDPKGKIVISGRSKDLIINKGINIYPQEIENVILLHPNVIRAGVIGKVDEAVGEIPIAFVQIREKDEEMAKSLKELCLKNLAAYKVPRQFICSVDPLPITATGKVDKKVLKKR